MDTWVAPSMSDPVCIVCKYPATGHAWVRPVAGGRRVALYFCDDNCRAQKLAAVLPKGWVEGNHRVGWDVFVDWDESDELPADLR